MIQVLITKMSLLSVFPHRELIGCDPPGLVLDAFRFVPHKN